MLKLIGMKILTILHSKTVIYLNLCYKQFQLPDVLLFIFYFQFIQYIRRGNIVPYLHCMNNCLWFIWAGRLGVVFRLDTIRPISVWTNKLKRDTTSSIIIKDYHREFWLSPRVSNRDPIIRPRALALGLIMVEG